MYKRYKQTFNWLFFFLLVIASCRLGLGPILVTLVGMYGVTKKKSGITLICYMFVPFLMNMNHVLTGHNGLFLMTGRFCVFATTFLIVIQASSRKGSHRLPVAGLYLYLVVAFISSMDGWFPMISYLKIVNFLVFLIGMHIGTRNLHHHPEEITRIRSGMLAFTVLLVLGSVATIPFPAIGYSMMVNVYRSYGTDTATAAAVISDQLGRGEGGMLFFSGMTNHSQTLAPLCACSAGWALCDMLLNEKSFSPLHFAVVVATPIIIFMTRSRVGLLGILVVMAVVVFIIMPKANVSRKMKNKARQLFFALIILGALGAVILEASSHGMTRWIRKTDDIGDTRSLEEAVTSSRMGSVEENMEDFYRRPLLGMGFQVLPYHREAYQAGQISLFSAPIEKGLAPLMILGETGVLGGLVFFFFMVAFYGFCGKKKYIVTASMFTVMLMLNCGEAVIFSPAAAGGCMWLICVVGGYAIDMNCIVRNEMERRMYLPRFRK